MSVVMFTMAHKPFQVPKDNMYVPLHVGRKNAKDLGFLGDDTGDNISELNRYYSELTGVYWIWKNYTGADYIGICHYRRYLVNENDRAFTEQELLSILSKYDLITTKRLKLNCAYYDGYAANHHIKDLDATGEVIRERYPDYYDTFYQVVHSNMTYFGNICVMPKKMFDSYAEWLFGIFFEVQKRIHVENYDDYHKRVFGFISEILLLVWVTKNKLNPFECKVGMLCEKAETTEMKQKLSIYFSKKDIAGAKEYFTQSIRKRPDVLMEASDLDGELKLSMQVIATSDLEKRLNGTCVLDDYHEFGILMHYFRKLNDIVERYKYQSHTDADREYLLKHKISGAAMRISAMLFCEEKEVDEVLERILQDLKNEGSFEKVTDLECELRKWKTTV